MPDTSAVIPTFLFNTTAINSLGGVTCYHQFERLTDVFFCPHCKERIDVITSQVQKPKGRDIELLSYRAFCVHCHAEPRMLDRVAMKNDAVHKLILCTERLRHMFFCSSCHEGIRTLLIAGIPSNWSATGYLADLRYNCLTCKEHRSEIEVQRPKLPTAKESSQLFTLGQQLLLSIN